MPQERWIVAVNQGTETLGQLLTRHREELSQRLGRKVGQKEVAAAIGLAPEQQGLLSRYERDAIARPNRDTVDKLAAFYGIPQETVALAVHQLGRTQQAEPLFPVQADEDVEALRRFARYLQESGEAPGSPSFEERIKGYARYLNEANH